MKNILFLSSFLLTITLNAQQWEWALHLPGQYGAHMDEDPFGNIYTTTGINSYENTEIRRMDPLGNVIWSKNIDCTVNDIEVSGNHVVIVGHFGGKAVFDEVTLQTVDGYDGFIACYDLAGSLNWVKQDAGLFVNSLYCVKITDRGEIYVAGYNDTTAKIDDVLFEMGLSVCVFAPSGIFLHNFTIEGKGASPLEMVLDKEGNIHLLGGFLEPILNVGGILIESSDTYYGSYFFAKLKPDGTPFWAMPYGTRYRYDVGNISVASTGEIYHTTMVTYDYEYLVKLNPDGNLKWKKQFGTATYRGVDDMRIDENHNLYLTGALWQEGNFGTCAVAGTDRFLFAAKADSSGNCFWVKTGQGIRPTSGLELSLTRGDLLILGYADDHAVVRLDQLIVSGMYFVARVTENALNTGELANEGMPFLFPNPSNGSFIIQSSEKISLVEVINSTGEKVFSEEPLALSLPLDLRRQPKGVYLVKMVAGEKGSVRKIVLE